MAILVKLYFVRSCDTYNHHTYIYKLDLVESILTYLDHLYDNFNMSSNARDVSLNSGVIF